MSTATSALSGTYNADPVHSSFGFAVKYQGVSLYKGTLDDVAATLVDGKLEGSAKVESISIRTPEQFRAHVLGAEFFDVENHPEVSFSSEDVDLADDGTAKVAGELTIKGITQPVEATGTWTAPAADAFGNTRGHLNLEGVVDRTEYGMSGTWTSPRRQGPGQRRAPDRRPLARRAGLARCGSSASQAVSAGDPTTGGSSGRRRTRCRPGSSSSSGTASRTSPPSTKTSRPPRRPSSRSSSTRSRAPTAS